MQQQHVILGAGMTGLAAGLVSGFPVFEATDVPGGICSSYYIRPGENKRLHHPPEDGEAYRFEIGGEHWIFGGDPTILQFISNQTPIKRYARRSSVYFREKNLYVPYPLQNNLRFLDHETATQALAEMSRNQKTLLRTMKEWLEQNFGQTLCELFFYPFHELYTAKLYEKIAPQDTYKTPVNLSLAIQGALKEAPPVGYNSTFVYPIYGLDALAYRMANACNVQYGKRAVKIDPQANEVFFADGSSVAYKSLISTLPLNRMLEMAGLTVDSVPDPYTSVLVLNIGAVKGNHCPNEHWLYNPDTCSGFHRVGSYSNVDYSFLPKSVRDTGNHVSIFVERAYLGGTKPTKDEITQYTETVTKELQEWGFIRSVEIVDPTWIDVAYTWSLPGSRWKEQALQVLQEHNIYQVGRYGRWTFQGIADSIRDGFFVGASMREYS